MASPREILIGLDAGTTAIAAVAFTPDGSEIARATAANPIARGADGNAEQDQGETWQRTATVVRQLVQRISGLARHTAALSVTGPAGGCWLVDEDGDAVAPAILPLDRRAEAVVQRWRDAGIAREIAEKTGCPIEPSSQSAQLAWLAECRPAALDRAASVLCGKDWLYFCCTGERASDPTAALGAFGNLATGAYDQHVLERLGLEGAVRLLPEIVDGTRHHGTLGAAAAAATGLTPGTPVVLGPIDSIAASLAAGLGCAPGLGCSALGASSLHVRSWGELPDLPAPGRRTAVLRFAGIWFGLAAQPATLAPDWLLGLAQQLLADAGLIGVPHGELIGLLEQKAAIATPGALRCRPADAARGAWDLTGLSAATTFHDLLRATHESVGLDARACYGALGQPLEVRLIDQRAANPLAREILVACLDVPVRPLQQGTPAAAGAALTGALGLGLYRDLSAADADWVLPHLGAPLPVDETPRAIYAEIAQNGGDALPPKATG
ncbi:MAG TPA: FGGY family carbohydrate kinase [Geminicoccaceae bacterium]|nr:FGGY family carbohydrate kinase [Geminicoccaceae bacterium]